MAMPLETSGAGWQHAEEITYSKVEPGIKPLVKPQSILIDRAVNKTFKL